MRTCIFSQEAEVFSEYKNQENIVETVIHKHLLAIFYIYPLYLIKILLFLGCLRHKCSKTGKIVKICLSEETEKQGCCE